MGFFEVEEMSKDTDNDILGGNHAMITLTPV